HAGGKELRAARLMNAFGKGAEHVVVSAEAGAYGAAAAIEPGVSVTYPEDFPALNGSPSPARLWRLGGAMRGYDLILTYNWGAMDAVMAHRLFGKFHGLPPLVHHEDGFNSDEAHGLKPARNWYRRMALGRSTTMIVPSRRLETIACEVWRLPPGRVNRIGNGIDTAAYRSVPRRDALPLLIKRPGERWLGTLAGLKPVKNLPSLVRAFAGLPDEWQLVIVGEGPEREAICEEARRQEVAHRVHLPGFVADPAGVVGLFDLFALSSDSEQFPVSAVEAMAAGLAVVSTNVGDVVEMVSAENRPFITAAGDETALAAALLRMARDEALRRRTGEANCGRAAAEYDAETMVAAYRGTYARALGRQNFP
ncbi:MAG TPA: glycosyltransferase, partial [Devosia sp.]|nr:glycosyltransferase [Devosia sp.]